MARTKKPVRTCVWEDTGEYYRTDCGHAFVLETGTPAENGLRFCGYCGAPLTVKAQS